MPAPNPALVGTPMAFLNDNIIQPDESYFMKDGREIPISEMPSNNLMSTLSFNNGTASRETVPTDFFNGNNVYFGQICSYNE